jgi:hypothetical protein
MSSSSATTKLRANAEPFFPSNYAGEKKALPDERYAKLAKALLTKRAASPSHESVKSSETGSKASSPKQLLSNLLQPLLVTILVSFAKSTFNGEVSQNV